MSEASTSTRTPQAAQDVIDFWFGPLDEHELAAKEKSTLWWKKSPEFDEKIRQKFAADYDAICAGEHESWRETPLGALAYVIVLDQFSRNMFRDSPKMYAEDGRAVEAALAVIDAGKDAELPLAGRAFLYMPLMHSEELAHQERCLALFEALVGSLEGETRNRMEGNLKAAVSHHKIVADWGRFPHRNAILGRESTPEELAFLETPGSSF